MSGEWVHATGVRVGAVIGRLWSAPSCGERPRGARRDGHRSPLVCVCGHVHGLCHTTTPHPNYPHPTGLPRCLLAARRPARARFVHASSLSPAPGGKEEHWRSSSSIPSKALGWETPLALAPGPASACLRPHVLVVRGDGAGGRGTAWPLFSVGAGVGSWLLAAPASKLMGTRMKYRDDALPITHPPLTHPPTHPPTHPRLTGSVMASTSDLDEQIERLRYVTRQAFPDWTDGVRKQQGGGCGS